VTILRDKIRSRDGSRYILILGVNSDQVVGAPVPRLIVTIPGTVILVQEAADEVGKGGGVADLGGLGHWPGGRPLLETLGLEPLGEAGYHLDGCSHLPVPELVGLAHDDVLLALLSQRAPASVTVPSGVSYILHSTTLCVNPLVTTRVALEDFPEAVLTVMTPALLVGAEAELGVTHPHRLVVHVLKPGGCPLPLPAGVLLRDVDAGLEHGLGPGLRVIAVRAPEVVSARADGHGLDTGAMEASFTTSGVHQSRVPGSAGGQRTQADGAVAELTSGPPRPVTSAPVPAAQTLELTEELHQAVSRGAAVEVVTLLAGGLGATHSGSLLLAEHTLEPRASPQLPPDVRGEEALDPLALLAPLAQARAEEQAEVVGRDVLQSVEEVTREDRVLRAAKVTLSLTQDNSCHLLSM